MKSITVMRRVGRYSQPILALGAVILIWHAVTVWIGVPVWLLPSPGNVLSAAYQYGNLLPRHIAVTLFETIAGLIVALVIGIPLAVVIVWNPIMRRTLYPVILAAQSVPKVALAPLFLIWIGYGMSSKVLVAASVAFFPIIVDGVAGLSSIDRDLVDMVRVLRASTLQSFIKIRIPAALPFFFSGTKVAALLAVVGALVAEFVGSNEGLGYLILVSGSQLNTSMVFVAITLLSIMGMLLYWAIELLQRAFFPWSIGESEIK